MNTDDGGSAFPIFVEQYHWGLDRHVPTTFSPGMTLRDYFAAKAMQSILSHLAEGIRPQDCIRAAEDAYFIADAMLKARGQ